MDNLGSRRVVEADGGGLARIVDGEVHYWLPHLPRATCAKTAEEKTNVG